MKYEPGASMGQHQQQDAGESGSHGSTGTQPKGTQAVKAGKYGGDDDNEYDKDGKKMNGGGYYKKGGKMYPMKKAEDLSGDDLQKSLDLLEDFAKSEDAPSRKEELIGKASTGELTKSENEELFQILGGGVATVAEPTLGETISKSLTYNEPLQTAVDVSGYLQENHDALVKSLGAVGDEIQKSDTRRHEFAMLQAKALVDIGNMMKSLAHTVGGFIEQPATGPKSRGVNNPAQPLNKSFGGQPPEGEQLNKSMVMDGLDRLMEDSMEKGQGGRLTTTNEDISLAVAKFEGSGQISPTMLEAVKRLPSQNTGASH